MIRAAILGAGSQQAGQLIRILIHHPDVEIVSAVDPRLVGLRVDSVHRGLIGDTDLSFSSAPREKTDVFFICGDDNPLSVADTDQFVTEGVAPGSAAPCLSLCGRELAPSQCVVDLTRRFSDGSCGFVYGVGEINRKPLVRGAKLASLGSPRVHGALIALAPLAQNLLLNSDIAILSPASWAAGDIAELSRILRSLQASFSRAIVAPSAPQSISVEFNNVERPSVASAPDASDSACLSTVVEIDCPVALDQILDIYRSYYDDHNFVFLIDRVPDDADVRSTNKCIVHLAKTGSRLRVTTVLDPRVKGDVGTAVHCMNLLFGLHERIGLQLPSLA